MPERAQPLLSPLSAGYPAEGGEVRVARGAALCERPLDRRRLARDPVEPLEVGRERELPGPLRVRGVEERARQGHVEAAALVRELAGHEVADLLRVLARELLRVTAQDRREGVEEGVRERRERARE